MMLQEMQKERKKERQSPEAMDNYIGLGEFGQVYR